MVCLFSKKINRRKYGFLDRCEKLSFYPAAIRSVFWAIKRKIRAYKSFLLKNRVANQRGKTLHNKMITLVINIPAAVPK